MKTLNVNKIHESLNELSNYITELHFKHDPTLSVRYGSEGKNRCQQDAIFHLNLLAEAFPDVEVYAASMAQASALGAALAIHDNWNPKPIQNDLIDLKFYKH
mgnify:CR=1 FL=1